MEKIYFDKDTYIWKTKLGLTEHREQILLEAKHVIDSQPNVKTDGFSYKKEDKDIDFMGEIKIKNKLDEIAQIGINQCKNIYDQMKIEYNKVNTDSWVNVVRSIDPVQIQFKHEELKNIDKYHTHTEINKVTNSFVPHYTYVYYIQMPDVMNGDDGVLYFKNKDNQEFWIRPEEDDLIIMEATMPHAPNNAPLSTIDRIVIAGNVGFEYIKKQKSLI